MIEKIIFFVAGVISLLAGLALVPAWIESGRFFTSIGAASFQGIGIGLVIVLYVVTME